MTKRKTQRYDWSTDDFEVSPKIELPDNLIPIVKNAPGDSKLMGKYLQDLVNAETITLDEVGFLLDSGVLE